MHTSGKIGGIHHITAICASPVENVAFYETVLGLRLVKQTVNFDDPYTYHLYWGDHHGRPGTILTFFPWPDLGPGRDGAGMVIATSFLVAADSLDYWLDRLQRHGVEAEKDHRFGQRLLTFSDPHGTRLELVGAEDAMAGAANDAEDHRIIGLHSATLLVTNLRGSEKLLTSSLGMSLVASEGQRHRFISPGAGNIGTLLDLVVDKTTGPGRQGSGSVHHIAFRAASDQEQLAWQQSLRQSGYGVSEVRDRNYFRSIYFREPGGVLFEIATDPPGFTVDEPLAALGSSLMLPPFYEQKRIEIVRRLPSLRPGKL